MTEFEKLCEGQRKIILKGRKAYAARFTKEAMWKRRRFCSALKKTQIRTTTEDRQKLAQIIHDVLYKGLSGSELENTLIESFRPEDIYESEDLLLTDAQLSLMHYASGEEHIPEAEWNYLSECLTGEREHNLDDKIQLTEDAEG